MKPAVHDVELKAQVIGPVGEPVRTDTEMEAVVNRGLVAAFLVGMAAGIAIMRAGKVPEDVATTVLNHPERRRATDWKR